VALLSKYEKLLSLILDGDSDANISFDDLRILLLKLGFEERTRGSHHVFRKGGIPSLINLQRDGAKAKAYQVRQVRDNVHKFNLKVVKDV